ncbi:response regulator transcription factor [Cryptosporangium arvum]|uniref:Response regulator containing a CheY-like receiver domain and an HTH DNA-binding domain n=1 Tax=Cryptosporangium arvum DSM 44712 TaxID=927661 RepID=A0A010ZXY3_9ACTN|nr:response regulator transcription factor [Cryptosporangium arvum]EXG82077.1 response regulator containing a CheY-like receiver domain and an HTH DNA-binding domain [Cryptosporangium arvum DSM 44712]
MRVLIAEDQVLLREGLVQLFTARGHDVVAAVGDAAGVLSTVEAHQPDLLLIDVRMPPTFTDEGTRAALDVKHAHPGIGVLVLSQHVDTTHAPSLVGLGGFGYLLKDRVLAVQEFLAAAQRVADGGSALDPTVVGALMAAHPLSSLSAREREVLELMAEGLNNPAIARRLTVSERTIESHVRHVMLKLDLSESDDGHRRVLAVLAYLRAHPA